MAGTAKGLRLEAPTGSRVRPTTDRVREATFNALVSLGVVEHARVLDLFAGSGALGIEALSRGAEHCTFCDTAPASLASVRANLERTGLADRGTVLRVAAAEHLAGREAGTYDLVLADPPYDFEDWPGLLGSVEAPLVVVESAREPVLAPGWDIVRQRRYGTTVVTIVERAVTSDWERPATHDEADTREEDTEDHMDHPRPEESR